MKAKAPVGAAWGRDLVVPIDAIEPNGWNPNRQDDETFAKELESIKRFGFISPLIVRRLGDIYEIIDGEHRWKAAMRLGLTELPVFDIGPISDHEARQLTIVLNELRGKPEQAKLGELLRGLLTESSIDELIQVLPYSKDEFGTIARMPEFDWNGFKEKMEGQKPAHWVERIFRMSSEDSAALDKALAKVRREQDDVPDAKALGLMAQEYLDG